MKRPSFAPLRSLPLLVLVLLSLAAAAGCEDVKKGEAPDSSTTFKGQTPGIPTANPSAHTERQPAPVGTPTTAAAAEAGSMNDAGVVVNVDASIDASKPGAKK